MNINPYNQVLENMRQSQPLIARYCTADHVQEIQAEIGGRIEERTLHILIYGAYNSGKSTLVNLLLGRERARVGDIPTTDRVDIYDWNGYRLLDTPGVNAPIEHEQVAEDQLARTNAVALVVREGDQDAKDVYDRLFSMMKSKKAIFIILNHQLGTNEEILESSKRIEDILSHRAADLGVTDTQMHTPPIYPVNLKTAVTGRMRLNDKLLEYSGFTRFVDAFVDWTRQHDNQYHHLSEVKDRVRSRWYDPVIGKMSDLGEEANGGSDAATLRDMERTLVAKKSRLHGAAYRMVASEVSEVRSDIAEVMRSSASQEEADRRLKDLVRPMFEKVGRWLYDELDDANARLEVAVESPRMSEDQGSMPGEASSGVRNILVKKVGDIVTNKENVKEVLLAGRGMKAFGMRDVLGLKGKWTRTLDKWAGGFTKVARGGMAVLQVAIALWDAKRAHNQQKEENEKIRRLAVESTQAIESICRELQQDLIGAMDEVIDTNLGGAIGRTREQIEHITRDLSGKNRHYQELLDLRNRLDAIVFTSTRTGA